jgi:hypothetical protein
MTIKSFKDAAYQAAKAVDSIEEAAKFVYAKCPTVLDSMPDDVKSELDDGWMLRHHEKYPEKTYVRVDGNLVIPSGKAPEKAEKVTVSVYTAMAYSQQAFGQLRNTDPALHGLISERRIKWKKYRGNRLGDLFSAIREMLGDDTKSTKAAVDDFAVYIVKHLDAAKTRCKNAISRGDTTADLALLERQLAAFWSTK